MNWKVIALVPALALATALPAYSATKKTPNPTTTTQVKPQNLQQSNTTKKTTTAQKSNIRQKSTNVAKRSNVLTVGSKGDSVKNAQILLKKQGFYTASVNGIFDKNTRAAVIKFQKSKGLRADGIIGHRTLTALQ
ncbi:peptidoglycan-binding domain-containing protein [Nostoc cycadae]|uniref:Peptidoglycan binding domain-containing protein n=1 Tax=Nostoc cycadae WK-1 TaxID=1861711 RepID=A0A2H6LJ17_9NOSO|nr:peptidoglycan-binding domain-containing protein [Nostoc cycadae]GBE93136.1 peptidoglycan binding domain-containing protein [Nostoc cycadae WK-1]